MKIIKSVATLAVCALSALAIASCQSTPTQSGSGAAIGSENNSDLSLVDAQARKARLSNIRYQLNVDLPASGKSYTGKSQIDFDLSDNSKPLRVDFFDGSIQSLTLNGQTLGADVKKKYWLELPAGALKAGANTLVIAYTQDFSHQGQGLNQFTDPETKETFLWSQFESFDANKFMPCFDQPDLRATLTMTVTAPAKWQVISTTRESGVKTLADQRKEWTFPTTQPIATYLFSLAAGPYKVWTDTFEDVPLRLFARPSLAKYVNAQEWFKWTKAGLKYYDNYFAFRYPFKKYDQIICPDYPDNDGAMENVAAVTFSESFVPRSQPTRARRRALAETLLHEMAHMWFGDTVTMAWWNDLWLNESFATFMSSQAMLNATEFNEAWLHFHSDYKSWAYWEDQLVTTHPIHSPINSVKESNAEFDGITYGKGFSALRQLWAYMGPDKFQKGLQNYIHTYAFKNADEAQFFSSLQAQNSQIDLKTWSDRWMNQSGTDRLSVKWQCDGDTLRKIEVDSTSKTSVLYRPQAVKVALFTFKDGKLSQPQVLDARLESGTETMLGEWACPQFVYPNYQDNGYALVTLDPVSLSFVKNNLNSLSDNLLRMQVWGDIWQMVRETEMPLNDYIQVVNTNFPREKNEMLLEQIVDTVSGRRPEAERSNILYYWPQNTTQEKKVRQQFIAQMENEYIKRMHASPGGSDEQKFWFDSLVTVAQTPQALDKLAEWGENLKVARAFTLDLDRRWAVARQLARYKHPAAKALAANLKKIDPSERGQIGALAIEAIAPDISVKRKWVDIVKQPKPSVSFTQAKTVLGSLFPTEQEEMAKRFENDFYDYLKANGAGENEVFVQSIANHMAPLDCESAGSTRLKDFLSQNHAFAPTVDRELKVGLQEDERCQRIRASSKL